MRPLSQAGAQATLLRVRSRPGHQPHPPRCGPDGRPRRFRRADSVASRLRRPRKFWQAFGLTATEIIFDVDDPEEFLRAFEERRTSLPPVQAHSAGAELRD